MKVILNFSYGQDLKNTIELRLYIVKRKWQVFAEFIRGGGYEVDVFTNPILASEKIGSRHSIYLLVLIGWRMPRLAGPDLALDLFKIDPEIKIILFSALDSQMANDYLDFIKRTFNAKFDHFSMPVASSELLYG